MLDSAPSMTVKLENIFIVMNTFGRGGAEMSLAILANELAKRGHKVTLLALWKDPNSYDFEWLLESGVSLTVLAESKKSVVVSQFQFFKLLRMERPTLIYSAMLYANFVAQTCAKLLGITHIVSVRNNPSSYYKDSLIKRVFFVLIMMIQDSIIFISRRTLSEYLSTSYGKVLRKKQFFVLHNPIAIDELVVDSYLVNKFLETKKKIKHILSCKNVISFEMQPLRCVIASRLVDGKGILETLEQIRVSLRSLNIQLLIYGAGNLEDKVRAYIDKEHLSKNVFLKGFESDLNKIFHDSDIFIFPSRSEGFGRAPFEALLRGNLVLCNSPVSIINEFLDNSKIWVTYSEPLDLIKEIKFFENISPDTCLKELNEVSSLLSYQAHVIAFEKIASMCIREK